MGKNIKFKVHIHYYLKIVNKKNCKYIPGSGDSVDPTWDPPVWAVYGVAGVSAAAAGGVCGEAAAACGAETGEAASACGAETGEAAATGGVCDDDAGHAPTVGGGCDDDDPCRPPLRVGMVDLLPRTIPEIQNDKCNNYEHGDKT